MKVKRITRISIFISLMCATAYIPPPIPIPFSPSLITMQTVIVNVMALTLTPADALTGMLIYFFIGMAGLPVFSGGMNGLYKIFGPSGGYVIGMIFAVWLMSLLKGKKNNYIRYLLVTIVVGIPVIYFCGMISTAIYIKQDFLTLLAASTLPFLFGDLLKCVLSAYIGVEMNKRLE